MVFTAMYSYFANIHEHHNIDRFRLGLRLKVLFHLLTLIFIICKYDFKFTYVLEINMTSNLHMC